MYEDMSKEEVCSKYGSGAVYTDYGLVAVRSFKEPEVTATLLVAFDVRVVDDRRDASTGLAVLQCQEGLDFVLLVKGMLRIIDQFLLVTT